MGGGEFGAGEDRGDRAPPVLIDRGAIVVAAVADVEAGKVAGRDAAAAAEEAVREIAQRRRADHLEGGLPWAHNIFRMMMSSSAWLPTMNA